MAAEGSNSTMSSIQTMITEMLRKQEENLLTAMTNQRQNIMEEVRSLMDQTLNSTMGATLPATQISAPQTNANPSLAPNNITILGLNLDHL